jgi:hypothetical protein
LAHICNLSYMGGGDQEIRRLRPACTNSLQDAISKITRAKPAGSVAQAVKYLFCKHKALSSNPSLSGPPRPKIAVFGSIKIFLKHMSYGNFTKELTMSILVSGT